MTIQIFGTPKCKDSRKAERFFKERGVKVHFVDLREQGISPGELDNISQVIPIEELIDTEGKQYRKRNLQYMKFDIAAELLDDPLLFKTPITRFGRDVTVGYAPDVWSEWLKT
jgi:arsenate reductase